ncbi:MAG: AAA family ATPase [Gammaproteobacteria bacterium]|nr:AAA family ATPase [Gammaproteobacteria bacterium]MCZ6762656.1 AAA family ATPase [Gammaproteobacteria bacterium]MCZ6880705.1 AAA family ATPase [Gammaproteobacteria bacterium]TDJ09913.1 MAG: AAA family ATPase [Gammaproteobacteria bacterium]
MYSSFFGLSEKPFSITPDPRYLYLSERHADAFAHLLYGITESGGFIQLTGEVGTGKTTLLRSLLEQLPENVDIALIVNPRLGPGDFLETICQELHVSLAKKHSEKDLVDALNRHLLQAYADGRRVVLMVDEAQNLSADVLEQVRLLTNLETSKQKLLQIILVGQPELRKLLSRNDLRQLAQRITSRFHLKPLDRGESAAYLQHRLKIAGAAGEIFLSSARREIFRLSGGVPRLINVIADRALLGAYTRELTTINGALVREAAAEVQGRPYRPAWLNWTAGALMLGATAALAMGVGHLIGQRKAPTTDIQSASVLPARPPDTPASATIGETPAMQKTASLQSILLDYAAETGTDNAFETLLGLWRGAYQPGETPACQQAAEQGLRCVFQQGSWAQLRQHNRPVILTLLDEQGLKHHLVLRSLNEGMAELRIGDHAFDVTMEAIARFWFGDYLLVWQPVSDDNRALSLGMTGADVRWLRENLDRINGYATAMHDSDLFDQELQENVREFQRRNRLRIDGIAGTQTLITLASTNSQPDTPVLIRR